jgi:hypothetical protein
MWRWITLLFLPVALLLPVACEEQDEGHVGTSGPSTGRSSYSEDDPEYQLAVIDAGTFVDFDDPSIDAYARALDAADAKCKEGRSLVGDYAVKAQQLLADEGINVTVLQALRAIDQSIPDDSPELDCAEIAAAWVVLMTAQ